MNAYEKKQSLRKERLENLSKKLEQDSSELFQQAQSMLRSIPSGQPILVGHHSEQRHRSFLNKMQKTYEKAFAQQEKAEYYDRIAKSTRREISSDDPDAIEKLKEKLEKAEENQDLMKKVNALIRKNDLEGLKKLGLSETQIEKLFEPDFADRRGFARYQLTNNLTNIQRIKKRIAELQTLRNRESKEEKCSGYIYQENAEENRILFIFSGKPDQEVREKLKASGFLWSPSRQAWVRKLNGFALFAAKQLREWLEKRATT